MSDGTLLVVLSLGLLIATLRDLQIREVPDLVSGGLIVVGVIGSAIITGNDLLIATGLVLLILAVFFTSATPLTTIAKTLTTKEHARPLIEILLGFAIVIAGIGLAISYEMSASLLGLLAASAMGGAMLATRQWGGGDAKLLLGVGAILGLSAEDLSFAYFAVLLILAGAVWGMGYTVFLAVREKERFLPKWRELLADARIKILRIALLIASIALLIAMFFFQGVTRILLGASLLGLCLVFYSFIFIKAIERGVMLKDYPVSKLTEGDWVAQDVMLNGKLLISERNTGITLAQIARLKKARIRKVKVREGIPFVPSFLLAFILLLVFEYLLGYAAY